MFSYQLYKVVHILGILMLFVTIGGLAVHGMNGGDKASNQSRKLLSAMHGISLVIILVGGFGLLARIGVSHGTGWPVWAYLKVVLWLLLGGSIVLLNRMPQRGKIWFFLLPLLGTLAAYTAVYKPFLGAAAATE